MTDKSWFSRERATATAKRIATLLLAVAVLLPVGELLSSVELFGKLHRALVNAEIGPRDPKGADRVIRVIITHKDYTQMFAASSPLDPSRLAKLIDDINTGRPLVIGVDIDTSDKQFARIRDKAKTWPVIWSRPAWYSQQYSVYWPSKVLGEPGAIGADQGLAVFPPDKDGFLRRYTRLVDTDQGDASTVPWALLKAALKAAHRTGGLDASKEPRIIRFAVTKRDDVEKLQWPEVSAGWIEDHARFEGWPEGPLKDRIVVLGGAYDPVDEHQTPVGWLSGVEILSQAIETELEGGGRKPVSDRNTFMIGLAAATTLWLLVRRQLRIGIVIAYGSVLVVGLSIICSLIISGSIVYAPLFALILAAVLAQQIWNVLKNAKRQEAGAAVTAREDKTQADMVA